VPCNDLLFTIEVLHQDGSAVILLGGELDIATASILRQAVTTVVGSSLRAVTLDLRGVTFVDVAGLRALRDAHRAVTAVGAEFRLRSLDDQTRLVIRTIDFHELEEATEPV
jgi:anti-sigma B factor antagonist